MPHISSCPITYILMIMMSLYILSTVNINQFNSLVIWDINGKSHILLGKLPISNWSSSKPPFATHPQSQLCWLCCLCLHSSICGCNSGCLQPQFLFSHALLELVDLKLFVRDGFLMSHLQPFSITHLCRFFNKNRRIHSDFSIPSALFSGSHCNGVNHSCSNCRCFHQCLAPKLIFFDVISHSNWVKFIKCSAQRFSTEKTQKAGKGWSFLLLNCWTQQRRFFFQKTPTKLKETTTSKTVSFCWCNICTESFGIRFLYLRPSTTCDL